MAPEYSLYLVRIFTCDWERSLTFYRDVLEFEEVFSDAGMGWAQFKLGDAAIGLERCDKDHPETPELVGRFVGVSIEVPDIEATYRLLVSRGVEFSGEPEQQPWGGVLAHLKDPDGNVLTLLGAPA